MKNIKRCSDLCGQIAKQFEELQTAIGQICNEQPKPLLADAKVGDWVELQSGEKKVITKVIHKPDLLSVFIGNNLYNVDGIGINGNNIIRLIPQGTPEWQKLETADLFAQYPNIERDLSKVKNGDTLLFDNGETRIAISSEGNEFVNADKPVTTYPYSQTFLKSNGKHRTLSVTCLGIVKRAKPKTYTKDEAFDLLDSGEVKGITRLAYGDNGYIVKPGNDDEDYCWNDGKEWSMSPADRKATDWVVVR